MSVSRVTRDRREGSDPCLNVLVQEKTASYRATAQSVTVRAPTFGCG